MANTFQNFLDGTIHDHRHLETVYERIDYLMLFKENIANHNAEKAKEALKEFYQYIDLDHQNYVPPEDLLAAAIGRTQFFHGLVYALLLDRLAPSVFAYSLSLVHIETINAMKRPEDAFIITCRMIDTYCDYVNSLDNIKTSEFSAKVLTLIDMNIKNELTTRILAEHLHLHPDTLQKKFKAETGRNITEVINERRVELSKVYLRSSKYSITDISYEVGFSDASYFVKVFKKFTGITPGQFRTQK